MRFVFWLSIAVLGLSVAACDDKKAAVSKPPKPAVSVSAGSPGGSTVPKAPDTIKRLDFPGTEEGAKLLLEGFLKPDADHSGLTKALRPASADYEAIFVGEAASKARNQYEDGWNEGTWIIKGKEDQTKLLLWKATTKELRDGTGDSGKFPGGYRKIADKLKPGLTFYRFKFVKPEDKHGRAFDGLVYVNGHWVLVSKPYRAL